MRLIDTDVAVDYLKGNPRIVQVLSSEQEVFITSITLAELFYGVHNSDDIEKHKSKLLDFLSQVRVLNLDYNSCELFGRIKSRLKKSGNIVGDLDLIIASIALSNGFALTTNNISHFQKIEELKVENY
ncbi:MAG: type II toxin-antitoxin system VapC family toxin [Candidatus Diapherotrites archaeon]|nr:type II toxin-antitoxin system VapC family toxin [Candidatus Diapherotrites archaeon]